MLRQLRAGWPDIERARDDFVFDQAPMPHDGRRCGERPDAQSIEEVDHKTGEGGRDRRLEVVATPLFARLIPVTSATI